LVHQDEAAEAGAAHHLGALDVLHHPEDAAAVGGVHHPHLNRRLGKKPRRTGRVELVDRARRPEHAGDEGSGGAGCLRGGEGRGRDERAPRLGHAPEPA